MIAQGQSGEGLSRADTRKNDLDAIGRDQVALALAGLRLFGASPKLLVHGMYRPAVQSAAIVAEAFEMKAEANKALDQRPAAEFVESLSGKIVVLVGEEPRLSQLLAFLILGQAHVDPKGTLAPGGMFWLQGEAKKMGMALRGHMTPEVLVAMRENLIDLADLGFKPEA
ncbi:histidine phosphatase family protein [Myxococcota bacterium]|nr:histidine phosphatase family protein [Myxococcota bacterium]